MFLMALISPSIREFLFHTIWGYTAFALKGGWEVTLLSFSASTAVRLIPPTPVFLSLKSCLVKRKVFPNSSNSSANNLLIHQLMPHLHTGLQIFFSSLFLLKVGLISYCFYHLSHLLFI